MFERTFLQPSGVLSAHWLLPDLWRLIAGYCEQAGTATPLRFILLPSSTSLLCLLGAAELSTVTLSQNIRPWGIACTPSGALIVTCQSNSSLYAIDPDTGHCERIAGDSNQQRHIDGPALSAGFDFPRGVEVVASERCAYVADTSNHCIRRLTLSPNYFVAPNT